MPYTAAQLSSFFTVDNGGVAPDATVSALIATSALQDAGGSITDAQALRLVLQYAAPTTPGYNAPASTTDVAAAAYEYVTGTIPTAAGMAYLLGNAGTGLDTAYYAGFDQESRYENLVIDLAVTPASAAAAGFAATYGALGFAQAVQVAYQKIVGSANVTPVQAAAAIADITGRQAYFTALAAESPALNQPLAAIAAMVGYVLNEAVKADVGVYAVALDNFNVSLATGGAVKYGTDITTTYPNTSPYAVAGSGTGGGTSSGGGGGSSTFTLTTAVDNLFGGAGATFNGTYSDGGIGGGNTFNIGDVIAGAGGGNTLNITPTVAVAGGAAAASLVDALWSGVSDIQTVAVTTNAGALNLATGAAFKGAFAAAGVNLNVTSGAGAITVDLSGGGTGVAFTGAATITATTTGGGAQSITTGSGATAVTATAFSGAQTIVGANLTTVTATNSGAGTQTITSTGAGPVTLVATGFSGAQTITTGAGADHLTVTTSAGATNLISSGAGNDTITLLSAEIGAHNTIIGGPGADIINLGGHAGSVDTLTYAAGDSTAAGFDVVTNMAATDLLSVPSTVALLTNGAYTAVQTGVANLTAVESSGVLTFGGSAAAGLSAATAITAATNLVALGGAPGAVDAVVVGGATYVVEYNATSPIVVELVGVNTSALGIAAATLHYT